ncbi:MAG: hypothetical protein AAFP19_20755, partial [Bacteroidota bacterium]
MNNTFLPLCLLVGLFAIASCTNYTAKDLVFPRPVDTSTRPIEIQEKKTYAIDGVYADNEFDAARLNAFNKDAEGRFHAVILPENSPINSSPWYAFRLWSDDNRRIQLVLDYTDYKHRYWPKISKDGKTWQKLDSTQMQWAPDSVDMILNLNLGPQKLWVAAQELSTSTDVKNWCDQLAQNPDVKLSQ